MIKLSVLSSHDYKKKVGYQDALQRERINGKWSHTFSVPILQPLAGTELIQNINIYFFYFLY